MLYDGVCNEKLIPDLELMSPIIKNESDLKLRRLFLTCRRITYLTEKI